MADDTPKGPGAGKRKKGPNNMLDSVRDKILALVRANNFPERAALAVGVGRSTYYEWRKKASDGDPVYVKFFEDIEQAQAEAECSDVVLTKQAVSPHKASVTCPNCSAPYEAEGKALLAMFGRVESAQRMKHADAGIAFERLARRFPRRWAPTQRTEVEHDQEEFLAVAREELPLDMYEKLLRAYLARRSQGAADAPVLPEVPPGTTPNSVH